MKTAFKPYFTADEVETAIEALGIDRDGPEAWNMRAYWQHERREFEPVRKPYAFTGRQLLKVLFWCAVILGLGGWGVYKLMHPLF